MILGMSTATFTLVHVILSLVGIVTGLVAIFGFITQHIWTSWNRIFLATTILTSVTGFLFPYGGVTPGIIIGVVSLVVLALAVAALTKRWVRTYLAAASLAEFLNLLVLIVQSFQKVPFLHAYAPKGSEPVVAITQGAALLLIIGMAIAAIKKSAVLVHSA